MNMAYEGEFRPGMVFEYVSGGATGQRRTLVKPLGPGVWDCVEWPCVPESGLRERARLVSAPPVEEAKPAARPLAEGWERLKKPGAAPSFQPDYGKYGQWACNTGSHGYPITPALFAKSETLGACEACAERAGVFADVVSRAGEGGAARNGEQARSSQDGPVPTAPTSPPSCNWTCSREHGTHGPRCGKAQWTRQTVADANAMMARASIVGRYSDSGEFARQSESRRVWAAAQHGLPPEPRPPVPRIRDCYREGDGADPDYVSGQGMGR